MNFVFLMDPLETVIFEKDTTFILMLGASEHHTIYYLAPGGISMTPEGMKFEVEQVEPRRKRKAPFERLGQVVLDETEVDALFIRTDPPFNYDYLMQTWLLDRVAKRIPVINHPSGIRSVNEKVWATQFGDIVPRTCVTRSREQFAAFLKEEKTAIVKPTDGFGGQGVFVVKHKGPNANVIFETVSEHGGRDVIVQQFIPEADEGDKRILLLGGDSLGAVLRLHGDDDHRNNFFAGGEAKPAEVTERDQEIISILKPHLLELGLHFVGIDVIGDYLIEVNVTSPTCLQEMNRLYDVALEEQVIRYVEGLCG